MSTTSSKITDKNNDDDGDGGGGSSGDKFNDDNDQQSTESMALFPGITITTSNSSSIINNENNNNEDNFQEKIIDNESKEPELQSSTKMKQENIDNINLESNESIINNSNNNVQKQQQQQKSNMVHFKKALIYSSTATATTNLSPTKSTTSSSLSDQSSDQINNNNNNVMNVVNDNDDDDQQQKIDNEEQQQISDKNIIPIDELDQQQQNPTESIQNNGNNDDDNNEFDDIDDDDDAIDNINDDDEDDEMIINNYPEMMMDDDEDEEDETKTSLMILHSNDDDEDEDDIDDDDDDDKETMDMMVDDSIAESESGCDDDQSSSIMNNDDPLSTITTTNATNITTQSSSSVSSLASQQPMFNIVSTSSRTTSSSRTSSSRTATNNSQISSIPQVITHVGRKPLNGPPCSLKTLVDDGILEPMDGSLTYEILGAKFFGDLLANGFIRMSGTNQVFANPSSWANYCRSTIPSTSKDHKNYGSAWSIIRYLGKRLDSYKLRWYRKQKKQFTLGGTIINGQNCSVNTPTVIGSGNNTPVNHHHNNNSIPISINIDQNNTPTGKIINNNNNNNNGITTTAAATTTATGILTPIGNTSLSTTTATTTIDGTITSPSTLISSFSNNSNKFSHINSNGNFTPITQQQQQQHSSFLPNHFSTPIQHHQQYQQSRSNVEYKNIYSMINRDRLYKLDKISAGDPEISILENNPNENIINFNSIDLNNKDFNLDDRTKIACVPFNSVFCLQPFLVTISTNVLLLIDFHSHLISTEVNGYLAGLWDPRTQHLTITQAFPLRCKSSKEFDSCTLKIKQNLVQKGLILVGWYHSHPRTAPHPSIADIKRQLKYQKQMLATKKDVRDYSPCVGLICSPFYSNNNNNNNNNDDIKLTTLFQMFWVMPIFTMGNRNIGRPMQISYQIARDAFLTQDLLVEMRVLAAHFAVHQKFIKFNDTYNGESTSYWNKLQESLKTKLPRDLVEQQSQAVQNDIQQQALMHFWSFLKNLLLIST